MNDIFQRQNSEDSLLKLRAQGRSYDQVKNYSGAIIILSIVVVLILNVLANISPTNKALQNIALIYGALATVLTCVLELSRASKKSFAARIQQLIDSNLFGMGWEPIWGAKPSLDEIQEAAGDEPVERYRDWYDEAIQRVNKTAAITICFRINIKYDSKLRNKFMNGCHILFWSIFTVIFSLMVILNVSLRYSLIYVFIPLLPVILLYAKLWINYKQDERNLNELRTTVEDIQHRLIKGQSVKHKEYVDVQSLILKHRENCFDVPSWYYHCHHSSNEESIHDFAMRIADKLLANQQLANDGKSQNSNHSRQ